MAVGNEQVTKRLPVLPLRRIAAGMVALAAIGALLAGAFVGLLVEAVRDWSGALGAFDPYMLRVVRFTLLQGLLSTVLSVGPAIIVARALSRHPAFPGRGLILRLFAVPLGLPAIVVALGVLTLYGRAGYLADVLSRASGETWPGIYGLSGILVAHVFFNLPLATRLFLQALDTVPADQWRLASQLGMRAGPAFRLIEWPVLRAAMPGIAGLVFMLCITSFTIVLTLGGGPRATTLEVAIYQALRFDFDPARAVALTVLQILLTAIVVAALARLGATTTGDANLSVASARVRDAGPSETFFNGAMIGTSLLFIAGPLLATLVAGVDADLARLAGERIVQRAIVTSLILALLSAVLSVLLSLALIATQQMFRSRRTRRRRFMELLTEMGPGFVLVVPPIVIGAGWFILLRNTVDVFAVAPIMVIAVNAVMAMPFAVRAIGPAYDAASTRHEKLCVSLGIAGLTRFRLIDWPALRAPIFTGLAFAMALSLGDLGVIALFGSDAVQTLPYLLYSRMGSYRTEDAAGLALLLGLLCLALMILVERLGKRHNV
ncbi:thiamine/thiamine pyrophosphate ABC transporter, permease protein [Mesorhizobium sp. NBSH29]|uniref:thiamine/thiamine pyrophosphate ABC transporter permease n=1 Tax=Mesorhizobium sp. NBSH29 TaxID=2654249 RepID=UPI0018969D66|nr:thiamine/thiamine pyrophosphate ABC transporter permease [Mesorhizobium sp. NBSH29]QPC85944.1 thiamine/thiamine pyrophosphate ABC transporter, permease protein [Mesorhizobium sp. NBSH29]